MKSTFSILLAVGAVSAETALLLPYAQCGGLTWSNEWQCETGTTCSPVGTDAFPQYQCLPNVGPVYAHAFPWAQCGGAGFVGPTLCTPGWTCTVSNNWFSTCLADAGTTTPPSTTPDLAAPGAFCGETAIARSRPAVCVPGYTCSGPGVFSYFVCLLDKVPASSTTTTTTTLPTTLATSTKSTTSTKKTTSSTTKKTTTSSKTASKTSTTSPPITTKA